MLARVELHVLVWCSMVLARVEIHVLACVLPHVLAHVLLHVLARVIIHVHDYYSKTCVQGGHQALQAKGLVLWMRKDGKEGFAVGH